MKADVRLVMTADGSHTAIDPVFNKPYHSIYGAYQESQRVYIELGLREAFRKFAVPELQVFEMGLGTGLNALLTAHEATTHQRRVVYTALEAYPIDPQTASLLNFDQQLGTSLLPAIHESPWQEPVPVTPHFTLTKLKQRLQDWQTDARFHLIYYDAFAPTAQPELWEPDVVEKLARLLLPGGLLTTYCSRSYVQRNLRAAGLMVEKHAGPRYKRDVLRAIKI